MPFKVTPRGAWGKLLCVWVCMSAHTHRYANSAYFLVVLEFRSMGDPGRQHSPKYLLSQVTVPQSFTLPWNLLHCVLTSFWWTQFVKTKQKKITRHCLPDHSPKPYFTMKTPAQWLLALTGAPPPIPIFLCWLTSAKDDGWVTMGWGWSFFFNLDHILVFPPDNVVMEWA